MKITKLTKDQLLYLLGNPTPLFQGEYGIISLMRDSLYKINYKDLINTYFSFKKDCLDEEIEILLKIEELTQNGFYNPQKRLEQYQRLDKTMSNDLIMNVLSYNGVYVGVEMKYYKGYINLARAYNFLSSDDFKVCIDKAISLIINLLDNDIVFKDIKESNILVNTNTLDVVLIDLDGSETFYGPKNYVKEYPYNKSIVFNRFNGMLSRLTKKDEIKVKEKK